jgi:hypothetical protein
MSLPTFSSQGELFSTAGLSASLFAPTDRYRLFAKLVYPHVARARAHLEPCYCAENGRTALEPVLMLGVSLLQELDGAPDRQAVERLRYHAGWNFALNRQLGDPVFHPTSLVDFRHRLNEHQQSSLAFKTVLDALVEAGLVSRQSRQRLDSTQMFGRVASMNRLDCVRRGRSNGPGGRKSSCCGGCLANSLRWWRASRLRWRGKRKGWRWTRGRRSPSLRGWGRSLCPRRGGFPDRCGRS